MSFSLTAVFCVAGFMNTSYQGWANFRLLLLKCFSFLQSQRVTAWEIFVGIDWVFCIFQTWPCIYMCWDALVSSKQDYIHMCASMLQFLPNITLYLLVLGCSSFLWTRPCTYVYYDTSVSPKQDPVPTCVWMFQSLK